MSSMVEYTAPFITKETATKPVALPSLGGVTHSMDVVVILETFTGTLPNHIRVSCFNAGNRALPYQVSFE
jgi:hypothetical protein